MTEQGVHMTTKANWRFIWEGQTYVVDHGERSLVAIGAYDSRADATAAVQELMNSSVDGLTLRERLDASYSIMEAGGVAICRFFPRDAYDVGRPVDLSIICQHVAELSQ
jgi:hypothetical protein